MITGNLPSPAPVPAKSVGEMLGLVGQIGYLIAIPAFLFGFGGAWLDKRFNTSPWLMVMGLALALTVSILAVYRIVKPLLEQQK